jgi:hypothetical protein
MPDNSRSAQRLLRWFALGSGPLKRGSDRLQVLARVLLVITVLTAIPFALAVVTASYSQGKIVAAAAAAERHRTTATLLTDAVTSDDTSIANPDAMESTVTWTGPSGTAHKAVLEVPPAAKAGSTVTIWIDRAGDATRRPATDGDVAAAAVGLGLVTLLASWLVATMAYLTVRKLLDRSRLRRWAEDWAVVEPVWTGKVA